jgi:hypothetical protein
MGEDVNKLGDSVTTISSSIAAVVGDMETRLGVDDTAVNDGTVVSEDSPVGITGDDVSETGVAVFMTVVGLEEGGGTRLGDNVSETGVAVVLDGLEEIGGIRLGDNVSEMGVAVTLDGFEEGGRTRLGDNVSETGVAVILVGLEEEGWARIGDAIGAFVMENAGLSASVGSDNAGEANGDSSDGA